MVAMMPSSAVTSVGSMFLNPWPSQSQTAVMYPSALPDDEEVTVSRHHTCGGRGCKSKRKPCGFVEVLGEEKMKRMEESTDVCTRNTSGNKETHREAHHVLKSELSRHVEARAEHQAAVAPLVLAFDLFMVQGMV